MRSLKCVPVGDVKGECKSLMEQLRGEALKFHKPGVIEPPNKLPIYSMLCRGGYFLCVSHLTPDCWPLSCRRELYDGGLCGHSQHHEPVKATSGAHWWTGRQDEAWWGWWVQLTGTDVLALNVGITISQFCFFAPVCHLHSYRSALASLPSPMGSFT